MSRFTDLSSADKQDFTKWLRHHLERGFLHRLRPNEQRTLLYAFSTTMRDLTRWPEFALAKSWAEALASWPYTEAEALDKLTECLELLIERYTALFYKMLFKE